MSNTAKQQQRRLRPTPAEIEEQNIMGEPGRPWTQREDELLAHWNACLGFEGAADLIASHDFGRAEGEGSARLQWLRENKPDLVCEQEARAKEELIFPG